MRCKCGYNSFDYNITCPKCRKDLTAIRKVLNLNIPTPGNVNFFQIANQRAAFAEPVLGGDDYMSGSSGYPEAGLGQAAALGAAASPMFGAFPDMVPTAMDDELDEITPFGASDDDEIDDIVPVDFSAGISQEAQPTPELHDYLSQPSTLSPQALDTDDEVEIEIDAGDSAQMPAYSTFMASPTPVVDQTSGAPHLGQPAAAVQAQAALSQIKTALSATGDLKATPEDQSDSQNFMPYGQSEGLADDESAEIEFPVGDFGTAQPPEEYNFPMGEFGATPPEDYPAAEFDFPVGDFGAAPAEDSGSDDFDFPVGDFGAAPAEESPAGEYDLQAEDFGAAQPQEMPTEDYDLPVNNFGAALADEAPAEELDFTVEDFDATPVDEYQPDDFGASLDEAEPTEISFDAENFDSGLDQQPSDDLDFPVGDFGALPDNSGEHEVIQQASDFIAPAAVQPTLADDVFGDALADDTFTMPDNLSLDNGNDLSSIVGDLDLDDLDNDL